MDWRSEAERLFFIDGLNINEIADKINKSRKSVGDCLKELPGFDAEKQRRKRENTKTRKVYQKIWDKTKRIRQTGVDYVGLLKRQHFQAVQELSHERYF